MKKRATAIAALVAAASLAGATSVGAHALPTLHMQPGMDRGASKVASVRLHSLLETQITTEHHSSIRPSGWGEPAH